MTTNVTRSARRAGTSVPPPRSPRRLTTRVAIWSARRPGRAIALWLLAMTLAAALGVLVAPRTASQLDLGVGESGRADRVAANAGYVDRAVENVLISAGSGTFDPSSATAVGVAAATALRAVPVVDTVTGPVAAADGSAVLVRAQLRATSDEAASRLGDIRAVVATVQDAHPDLRVEQVGDASIHADFQDWLGKDLQRATMLSLPVTLVILLVAFGALAMAATPVILGIAAVAATFGLWSVVSQAIPDPGMVGHIILLVGMAVGVDYSLFYMRRYREERHHGTAPVDAVRVAAATAGHSVIVSGAAVVCAMAGLFITQDAVFEAMAAGAVLVVIVALGSSLTVLPALLSVLGRWVDRPRVPIVWRLSAGSRSRTVGTTVGWVVRHPVISSIASALVVAAMSFPLLSISLKATQVADFPRNLTTMQTYDRLVAAFPGDTSSDVIVTQVPAGSSGQLASGIKRLTADVAARPDVFADVSHVWTSTDGTTARIVASVPHAVDSASGRDSVALLRGGMVQEAFGSIPGATYGVSGDIASDLDYTRNLEQKLPIVIAMVLLMTFVVMWRSYRSLVVALVTVVLNAMSLTATFGVLVLIFQNTWAEGLLGFTSTGHVVSWVPMLLIVVLAGLSLDYHVFVVSRIRENVANGQTIRQAVRDGIARTAGVVAGAAAVMIGVFSIFGALTFIELKQIGVGLAVGIVIDVTVIRIVTLPAFLVVCRRWLWPAR
ncbi:MAG: MMPL family transporter [Intrasporangium sp.]|uniref:MMPL family transporter n=1 Tax=Intrasporangium sp. TaxID=1925024 RepID=UPI002648E12E|nr:MMPL family transporter [Intrasporangium sp.]MDN5794431.1 MMPL family transporter [Intrasporangium sp.]